MNLTAQLLICVLLVKFSNVKNISGKRRTKLETALNTNRQNPGGHERKIVVKLRNAEKNNLIKKQERKRKDKILN